jgi:hypothetical protein
VGPESVTISSGPPSTSPFLPSVGNPKRWCTYGRKGGAWWRRPSPSTPNMKTGTIPRAGKRLRSAKIVGAPDVCAQNVDPGKFVPMEHWDFDAWAEKNRRVVDQIRRRVQRCRPVPSPDQQQPMNPWERSRVEFLMLSREPLPTPHHPYGPYHHIPKRSGRTLWTRSPSDRVKKNKFRIPLPCIECLLCQRTVCMRATLPLNWIIIDPGPNLLSSYICRECLS